MQVELCTNVTRSASEALYVIESLQRAQLTEAGPKAKRCVPNSVLGKACACSIKEATRAARSTLKLSQRGSPSLGLVSPRHTFSGADFKLTACATSEISSGPRAAFNSLTLIKSGSCSTTAAPPLFDCSGKSPLNLHAHSVDAPRRNRGQEVEKYNLTLHWEQRTPRSHSCQRWSASTNSCLLTKRCKNFCLVSPWGPLPFPTQELLAAQPSGERSLSGFMGCWPI